MFIISLYMFIISLYIIKYKYLESLPNNNNPGTGDNIMLYVTMLIFSIIGLVGIILIKRKRFS